MTLTPAVISDAEHFRNLDPADLGMIFDGAPVLLTIAEVTPDEVQPFIRSVLTITGTELDTVGFWELRGAWGCAPGAITSCCRTLVRVLFTPAGDDIYDLLGFESRGGLPILRCPQVVTVS